MAFGRLYVDGMEFTDPLRAWKHSLGCKRSGRPGVILDESDKPVPQVFWARLFLVGHSEGWAALSEETVQRLKAIVSKEGSRG